MQQSNNLTLFETPQFAQSHLSRNGQGPNQDHRVDAIITIFYSNYSANSKALLQLIKNANLTQQLSIKFINIDNSTIKNIVLKKFSVVPSMVVILNDEMSLYSGDNVFEWFHIFMSTSVPSSGITLAPMGQRPLDEDAERAVESGLEGTKTEINENRNHSKTIMEIAAEIQDDRNQ